MLDFATQQEWIKTAKRAAVKDGILPFDTVEELDAGHNPWHAYPDRVASIISDGCTRSMGYDGTCT